MSLRLTTYLVMNGNAKEAIDFYEKALDAKLLFCQTFGEMPENPEFRLPEGTEGRISHAMIRIGESDLMLSDTFPGQPHQSGNQVTICITTADPAQARQIYDALSQDGQIQMPLQDTFFSPSYGIVTDKFGVNFHIYTEGKQ